MSVKVRARDPRVESINCVSNCAPREGLPAMNTADFIEPTMKVNNPQRSCFVMQSVDILGDDA
jgi:hypothetical protein